LITYDGQNYQSEDPLVVYWGSYFFLSDYKTQHKREVYGIIAFIEDFGGLFAIFFDFLIIFGGMINQKLFMGKLIKDSYFIKLKDKNNLPRSLKGKTFDLTSRLSGVDFGFFDMIMELKKYTLYVCCCSTKRAYRCLSDS